MTTQISDIFQLDNRQYSIANIKGNEFFHPQSVVQMEKL